MGRLLDKQKRFSRAFTLVELLDVVAIIAILAGLLLPTLGKAKTKAHGVDFLGNLKKLNLAWGLYADDTNENLAAANGWVTGWMHFNASKPDNTNLLRLLDKRYAPPPPYPKPGGF